MKNYLSYAPLFFVAALFAGCDSSKQEVTTEEVKQQVEEVETSAVMEAETSEEAAPTDISTWQKVGEDPWRFSGEVVEAGPAEVTGFLVANEPYGDFRLTLEYWIEDDTNSGIYIRCPTSTDINPDDCYEINIWDNHPNSASRTGGIVKLAETQTDIAGLERWVKVEVIAEGNRIRALFDDQVTADIENDRSANGALALQYAGKGVLKFRNVLVESL